MRVDLHHRAFCYRSQPGHCLVLESSEMEHMIILNIAIFLAPHCLLLDGLNGRSILTETEETSQSFLPSYFL